jgi:copper resistance protein B
MSRVSRNTASILLGVLGVVGLLGAVSASAQDQHAPDDHSSEARHVPPDPPQHPLATMPYAHMAEMMQMDDTERFGKVLLDQLEWRHSGSTDAGAWDAQGWYGGDYNKLWVKTEGEVAHGSAENARVDVLWDRIVTRWWNFQAGARADFGKGPSRTWAAIGLEGLAPYWFDTEATLYVGDGGRTAARLKAEYDVLLTQRLIAQPEIEANVYGKPDPARQLGSGLSDLEIGLRVRYEFRRELAPYVGVNWSRRFGRTGELARAAGEPDSGFQLLVGLRAWL